MQTPQDHANVIIFPPLLYVGTWLAGVACSHFLPLTHGFDWSLPAGIGLALAGSSLVVLTARTLVQHRTAVNPRAATTVLVQTGLFRFSRNPMYIGFGLLYMGCALILEAWIAACLLLPLLVLTDQGIIAREERYLEAKFGAPYIAYKSRVNRWF